MFKGSNMENEKNLQDITLNEDFQIYLNSLKETYAQSSLKEKHKLNEHIKYILKIHKEQDTETLEKIYWRTNE